MCDCVSECSLTIGCMCICGRVYVGLDLYIYCPVRSFKLKLLISERERNEEVKRLEVRDSLLMCRDLLHNLYCITFNACLYYLSYYLYIDLVSPCNL